MSVEPRVPEADGTRQVLWVTAAAVVILIGIAIVAATVVSRQLDAARTSHEQVLRTRETLAQVRLVFSTLQDAEIGEHGYVITGNEVFLDPYHAAVRLLDEELERLRQLIADRQSVQILDELENAAHAELAFLTEVIELRRSKGSAAAVERIRPGAGKGQMDRIRELVAALRSREETLLNERLASFASRSLRSERIMRAALAAAILLLIAAAALLAWHTSRRVKAEAAARDAQFLLRSMMDKVTEGIALFDSTQRLLAWNARYIELRGLDPSQVRAGMRLTEIIGGATLMSLSQQPPAFDLSVVGSQRSFDVEITRADGVVLHVRGRPMSDGNYIVTYSDVTALKLSESAYRDQATRLTSILDNVVDAIVTINESGSIESWSKGAERLFGYTTEEVLRRNVRMLMPEPHASAHDGYIRRYIQTGERRIIGIRRELQALHKDGRRIPVDLGISEMRLGTRRLFIGIVRDISARQEIEQLKSSFVSTVSHELRTPLTSISGSLGLLAGGVAGALPAKAARLIDIAKLNCERLVRLINDILDLEKAESGRLEFRLEPQSLKPIMQHAIDLNRAYAHNFGAVIELDPQGDDPDVLVDRDRLIQVLTNILSNAAKFSPRGGLIYVSIRDQGDMARVSVRDEGPGIAPEFQGQIFQKFAQADSSDSRTKGGTGLGLSIAKTIIERLGGRIGYDNTVAKGATFYITLPIRRESAMTAYRGSGVASGSAVLICEDDPDVAQILVEILRREGMRAEAVSSARAARAALDAIRFEVALIDLHLPDADGLEFITELRARESTRSLPVIVMTARARAVSDAHQVGALQLADWLQKPIDPRRLLEAIHNALREVSGRRARILHIEDDESLTQLVKELLSGEAELIAAHSLAQARQRIDDTPYDLVILDITLGDGSGLDVLPLLGQGERVAPPVILYSASEPSGELSSQVQAALVKSRDSVDQLLATVRALADRRSENASRSVADGLVRR